MEPWQAFLLGVIEGITEYLPVSSTGHLVLAQRLMGIGTESEEAKLAADAFAICIQGGAILAVLGLYYKRVLQMIRGVLGEDAEGLRLAINILAGFLPAAVLGLLFNDLIEKHFFHMWPIIFALVVGGIAILVVSRIRRNHPPAGGTKDLMELTWKMALIIGLLQCVAMWPGTSRSLMTIMGGLIVGMSIRSAVEYSFLLGVLTLTAATAKKAVWGISGAGEQYEAWFGGTMLMWDAYGGLSFLLGIVAATISAALAVKWLVTYLQSHGLALFGWYRIAVGLTIAALVVTGVVDAR
jgi:undecaprenyl-diphosphatase